MTPAGPKPSAKVRAIVDHLVTALGGAGRRVAIPAASEFEGVLSRATFPSAGTTGPPTW